MRRATAALVAPVLLVLGGGLALIGLKVFPIVVVGGMDSLAGTVVGALLVGVLESQAAGYLNPLLGAGFSSLISYVVLIGFLMARPYGLFGSPRIERV